jgi:hypothetical protein
MVKYIVFGLFLLLNSCVSSKLVEKASVDAEYISFTKVKVKVKSSKLGNLTCKGYIYLRKDTSLCFKFFGPLSYELINGEFKHEFKIYDCYNKRLYGNVLELLKKRDGIIINLKVVENLLLANSLGFTKELLSLNEPYMELDTMGKKGEVVIKINKSVKYQIRTVRRSLFPKTIVIECKDEFDNYSIYLEFLAISNERKKCTFNF